MLTAPVASKSERGLVKERLFVGLAGLEVALYQPQELEE